MRDRTLLEQFKRTRSSIHKVLNEVRLQARLCRPEPNFLMQTVVEFGRKTGEGQLIEAVTIPWFRIIRMINDDPTVIFKIKPRKWEEMIAGWYEQSGFDEVTLTPSSGDRGRDVIDCQTWRLKCQSHRPGESVQTGPSRFGK